MSKKRFFTGLLASAVALASIPFPVMADTGTANTNFDSSDLFSGELIVLIPDEVPLELVDSTFVGTGNVTAWGTAAASTLLTVSTDTEITYTHEKDSNITVDADVTFGTDGVATWGGTTLRSNVDAVDKAGYEVSASVSLDDVDDIGTYNSVINFNISVGTAPVETLTYYMGYKYVTVQSYTDNDDTIRYEFLPSGDTVAELQAFSTDRAELEAAGYDYIVESTDKDLVIPNKVNDCYVVGVSFDNFFAEDDIANYVSTVQLSASVEGIELTDTVDSASETIITSYNLRTATNLSKTLPDDATLRFAFEGTDPYIYTYESDYCDTAGYVVVGLSHYGLAMIEKNTDSAVTLKIPDTYLGEPVIGLDFDMYRSSSDGLTFEECLGLEDSDVNEIDIVCGANLINIDGAWNGNNATKRVASKVHSLTLNEGLKSIAGDAFANSTSLTEVHFPSTIESIGTGAFSGCTNLETITFAEGTPASLFSDGYTSSRFGGCNIKEVTFPSSMTTVCSSYFNNSGLKIATFNNNAADMDSVYGSPVSAPVMIFNDATYSYTVSDDKKLTGYHDEDYNWHFTSDDDLTNLGSSVSLEDLTTGLGGKIVFDEGITTINVKVGASEVQLPSTVTSIGSEALSGVKCTETLDVRGISLATNAIQYSTIDTLVMDSTGFTSQYVLQYATIENLYIDNTDTSAVLAKYATSNLTVTNIYFSGTEDEWTTFVGSNRGNTLTSDMTNVTFNATMPE